MRLIYSFPDIRFIFAAHKYKLMFIYNITFTFDQQLTPKWKSWLKSDFQKVVSTQSSLKPGVLLKVHAEHTPGTDTFSYQLIGESMEDMALFRLTVEPLISESMSKSFGQNCMLFSSILEEV